MRNLSFLKVYSVLFAVLGALTSALLLLAYNSINFTGDINRVIVDYSFYEHKLWQVNIAQYALLTIMAAVHHLRKGNRLLYIPQLLLFIVIANLQYMWLYSKYFQFRKVHDILEGGFDAGFMIGIFQSLLVILGTGLLIMSISLVRKKWSGS